MIRTEDLAKLVNMAVEIQVRGQGNPYVSFDASSLGRSLVFRIDDEGYRAGKREHDGVYEFPLDAPISKFTYKECEEHLERLLERVRGFREEADGKRN